MDEPQETEVLAPPYTQVMGWHIDLGTIERGQPVVVPQGWNVVAVAEKTGNDLVILLQQTVAVP